MFNLIAGAACLPVALSSELPVSCSLPDRCNALPQIFWMLCSQCPKTVNVLVWRMQRCLSALFRKTCGSPTSKACVHLIQSPLISVAWVSFSTGPILQLLSLPSSPMLFEDDGSIRHVPPAKKCKAGRCTNMSISKSYTMQLDSADIRKTSNSFSSLGCQREATPCHTGTITPGTGADTSLLACSGSHLLAHSWWKTVLGGAQSQPSQSIRSSWHMGARKLFWKFCLWN